MSYWFYGNKAMFHIRGTTYLEEISLHTNKLNWLSVASDHQREIICVIFEFVKICDENICKAHWNRIETVIIIW